VFTLDLNVSGPIQGQLDYINRAPFNVLKNLPPAFTRLEGESSGTLSVSFPLRSEITREKIRLDGNFDVEKIHSPHQALNDGKARIVIDSAGVMIDGQIGLVGAPILFSAHHNLNHVKDRPRQKITLNGTLDFPGLVDRFIPFDLHEVKGKGVLSGEIITDNKGKRDTTFNIDLDQAGFDIAELGFNKKIGTKGKITLHNNGTAEGGKTHYDALISWPQLQADALIIIENDGTLDEFSMPKVTWGDNHATINYQNGETPLLILSGSELDLSSLFSRTLSTFDVLPAQEKKKLSTNISFERVILHDRFVIPNLDLGIQRQSSGIIITASSDYGEDQRASLTGQFTDDKDTIRGNVANLGDFLQKSLVSEDVSGGALQFVGFREKANEPFKGEVLLENSTLHDAPLFLHVFSALSLFLGSPDLFFDGFLVRKGVVNWQYDDAALSINHLLFGNNGQRIGMRGVVDFQRRYIDVNGQYVPFLPLTTIIERIPLVGSLLSGGSTDGFAGISYSVRGDFDSPQSSVQPLSIFAPGALKLLLQDLRDTRRQKQIQKQRSKDEGEI
jgi:hypothetical protein